MRKEMIIVSMRVVAEDTMEIGLVPCVEEKKKKTLFDIALNGDLSKVINEVHQAKQKFMDLIYRPVSWCNENNLNIYRVLKIDVEAL